MPNRYAPAYQHYGSNINMVHFIGTEKPWMQGRKDSQTHESRTAAYGDLVTRWWSVWDAHYRPLSEQDPSLTWKASNTMGRQQLPKQLPPQPATQSQQRP